MLGLEAIIAIIGLSLQVVGAVDKVVHIYGRIQNTPDEIQRLRRSVVQLHDQCKLLEEALKAHPDIPWSDDGFVEIQDTLLACQALLNNVGGQRRGMIRTIMKASLLNNDTRNVGRYQKQIEGYYVRIIIPFWLRALPFTLQNQPNPTTLETAISFDSSVTAPQLASSQEDLLKSHLDQFERALKDLQASTDPTRTKTILRHLNRRLLAYYKDLGLSRERIGEFPELELFPTIEDSSNPASSIHVRRDSKLDFEDAPTTLILESAPEPHNQLQLESVHIMAEDDEARIIQYRNDATRIQVTHIIPKGCIPWTAADHRRTVSFLHKHVLTVIDADGSHVYYIDPKYHFQSDEACTLFQATLRHREYLGAHFAVEITRVRNKMSKTQARRQIVKFWRRDSPTLGRTVTMTYHPSSDLDDDVQHVEVNLLDYMSRACYGDQSRRGCEKVTKVIEITHNRKRAVLCIKFEDVEQAMAFKEEYTSVHPYNAPDPQLSLPSSSSMSSTTPAATPSDVDWAKEDAAGHMATLNLDEADTHPVDDWRAQFKTDLWCTQIVDD